MTNEAFQAVVEQYQNLVYTICYQLVRDAHTAQDLTQETFLSAYTHSSSFTGDNMKPWLARIATNKAKDHLKSAYNRRVQTEEALPTERAAPPGQQPEQITETDDGLQRIQQAIQQLKEPYLQVAVLYFYKQLSVAEIARQLDRPPKTVETQLYRARHKLQEILKEESG